MLPKAKGVDKLNQIPTLRKDNIKSFMLIDWFIGNSTELEEYLKEHNLPCTLVGDERSFDTLMGILNCDNKRKE